MQSDYGLDIFWILQDYLVEETINTRSFGIIDKGCIMENIGPEIKTSVEFSFNEDEVNRAITSYNEEFMINAIPFTNSREMNTEYFTRLSTPDAFREELKRIKS